MVIEEEGGWEFGVELSGRYCVSGGFDARVEAFDDGERVFFGGVFDIWLVGGAGSCECCSLTPSNYVCPECSP